MSIGAILIGLALLLLTIPFVVRPFRRKTRPESLAVPQHRQRPTAQHQEVLLALRDLEFDYRTGKIAEEDYAVLRADLLAQAAAALEGHSDPEDDLDAQIEAAVLARRRKLGHVQACQQCGKAAGPGDRFCTGCGAPLEAVCPACGKPMAASDRFCAACGAKLDGQQQPAALTLAEVRS